MSGKSTRAKGRRGETEAKELLISRDWTVADLTSGLATEDLLVTDTYGRTYACEVKNTANILESHKKQAMEQAKKRRLPWMLMNKLQGTNSWLIRRQGATPIVWTKLPF